MAQMPDKHVFNGIKFWLSARVPMRKRFVDEIKANGGHVVALEKQADMLIVDHKQKDIPANSFSYTYIDKSLRHSALEDSEDHRAGPAQLPPRPVGSSVATAKGTRTPFSAEDDQILLAWVGENAVAGRDAGNKIFQELGAKNPRHTWQSWRDRYVKRYRGRVPPNTQLPGNLPPTPPTEPTEVVHSSSDEDNEGLPTLDPKAAKDLESVSYQHESVPVNRSEDRRTAAGIDKPSVPVSQPPDETSSHSPAKLDHKSSSPEVSTQHTETQGSGSAPDESFVRDHEIWMRLLKREGFQADPMDSVASLLASALSILAVPDEALEESWKQFAETFRERSQLGWAAYWSDEVLPFYTLHHETFKQEVARATSGQTPELDQKSPERDAESPEFSPDSPEVLSTADFKDDDLKTGIERDVTRYIQSSPPRHVQESILKRSRDIVEEEWNSMPDHPPWRSAQASPPKRPRLERSPDTSSDNLDISSTPEVDAEVETQPRSLYPALPPDSDDEGQNFLTSRQWQLSETLAEPEIDTQGKVDAQIFADIRVGSSIADEGDSGSEEPRDDRLFDAAEGVTVERAAVPDIHRRDIVVETPTHAGIHEDRTHRKHSEDYDKPFQEQLASNEVEMLQEEDSQEAFRTQTHQRTTDGRRTFKPAAFRNEDESRSNSPELFVRTPTPPLRSSPPVAPRLSSPAEVEAPSQRPDSPTGNDSGGLSELEEWVDAHLADGLPYERIQKAIMSTSMDLEQADAVLGQMKIRGKDSVPGNMEGVWTEADDDCLLSDDPKMLGVVTTKHGSESVDERLKFLRHWEGS